MVLHMEFLFTFWYPKGSKKFWPKCHSGQSATGQSVTLAKVTLAKLSLWPKCLWPKGRSGQSVALAKVSFWPKCNSACKSQVCFNHSLGFRQSQTKCRHSGMSKYQARLACWLGFTQSMHILYAQIENSQIKVNLVSA